MIKTGIRPILRGVLVLSGIAAVILSTSPQWVGAQEAQNLLRNGGFEEGWYDVSGTQQCPNHWRMYSTEGEEMGDPDNVTALPESRVLPKTQVPASEHSLYFWDGNYTLKMFWAKAPIHVAIAQDVSGLEPGREYRFVVPVFVDTFNWDSGKFPPDDPYAAQVRLGAGPKGANWRDEAAINFSDWANGANTSPYYLARTTLQFDFVATAPEMTVFVEYASKWGLDNNGIFMDALRLEPLGVAQEPTATPLPETATPTTGPSPTPLPTSTPRPDGSVVHVVQSGDTLTSIALKYGVTVDQIRELNSGSIGPDNLIRTGQELVISVSDEAATATPVPDTPTPTPESEPEATPSPTEEPEEASICVLAFHDRNRDTVWNSDDEDLLPNVSFTLVNASGVVEEYTTDGVSEPHCFTGLAAGSYRVVQQAPAGYEATGLPEQNVALLEGTSFDFEFGNAREEAAESPEETGEGSEIIQPEEETDEAGQGPLLGNVLVTVARVAGILVLVLAGAIAVLFVLSRRRRY